MKRPRARRAPKARLHSEPLPQYHQAYPSFSIPGVARRLRLGERHCEWFTQHHLVGQMDVVSLADHELEIFYSCGRDTYRSQRTALFTVLPRKQASDRQALRAWCPGCSRFKLHMLFRGGAWRCRECHHLTERRTYFGATERLIARREQLIKLLHPLDRQLDSHAAYVRYSSELVGINARLDAIGKRYMAPILRHETHAVWFSDENERTEREAWDETPPYIDQPWQAPVRTSVVQPFLGSNG